MNKQHNILSALDLHVPGYQQAGDPGAIGEGKFWIDTTLGTGSFLLKTRNALNTDWETIRTPAESIAHGDLSDMPDVAGTNSDHDTRYYTETEVDTNFFKLDQTTPQDISNGQPDFLAGLRAGSTNQFLIGSDGIPSAPSYVFEKGTYDLTLAAAAITGSAKTITFPNTTGTVALTSDLHSAATVLDGSTIDFTLTGQQITAEVITGAIDHDSLLNWVAAQHIDWTNASNALLTTAKGEFGSGQSYYADIADNASTYAGYFSEGSNTIVLQSAAEALKISDAGGTHTVFKKDGTGFVKTATFALAIGIAATTGTNKTNGIIVPRTGEIVKAFAYAKTGPTGAALIFDINLNGSTIWATQGNRVQIAAGATSGTQTSFDTTAVTEADILTIDIDQVGSTIAGQDITVELLLRLRNQ